MKTLCALLIAATLAAAPCTAQTLIAPGSSALQPRRIRTGVDTIVVLVAPKDSAEHAVATMIRRIERLPSPDGRADSDLLRETQVYDNGDGSGEYDTLEVAASTLEFHRIVESYHKSATAVPSVNVLQRAGDRIRGSVTLADSGVRTIDVPAVPLFHDMAAELGRLCGRHVAAFGEPLLERWPVAPLRVDQGRRCPDRKSVV